MIKGLIFDMDGTILNTIDDIHQSVNYALSQFDLPLNTIEHTTKSVGNGAYNLLKRSVPSHTPKDLLNQVFEVYRNHYEKHAQILTAPYPGIIDLLKNLKTQNYLLAVVSNKYDEMVKLLNHQMFEGLFDVSVGEKTGIPIKPEPDMIMHALGELGLTKDEIFFIGDSDTDMQTAINAKIKSVAVTWGFRTLDVLKIFNPTYIIHHPSELLEILDSLK